ncbi:hypothetical protein BOX15_Mlig022231g2 [Macrostomum lignano]|uniref:RRM domain-containing protein n=1 Tax=Macrostomum lignano TaxID=282301 RepID=A0A267G2Q8_9PLAT|nr:hypothetical protein BOX15_Mlig022231g2 [Macrostomum lignano]
MQQHHMHPMHQMQHQVQQHPMQQMQLQQMHQFAPAQVAPGGAAVERKRKFNGQHSSGQQNPPSCVVFVGEIPGNTCELEIRRIFQDFGKVQLIFPMPAKHQALVEYLRLADAERLIAYHHSGPGVNIKGSNVIISFSNRSRIDLSQEPYLSIGPQNCLLLTIYNMKMEFNCTDVRQICSPYAIIERCVIIKQQDGLTRAIVEFERLEDAALAKPFLNGANMYTNCNAIRCDYARANAFEYFMSRETVLEEYRYDIDADSMTSMSMVGAASGAGAGMNKRARVVPGGGGGGGLLGNPNDEVGLLGTRLQGLVGAGPGHAIGGVVGRPGQLGGAGVGAAGGAANQELLAQSAMSLVSRVAAAAAAANPAAAGGFAAPYGHPQAGQNIIVVRGLSSQMNCDRLFNVLVLYGNVSRVKFLTTKEGFALVEMCDSGSAQQALQHLNGQRVLGSIVRVSLSDQDNVKRNTKDFTLPDGTLAEKSYDSLKFNRFMTPESAAKNQASLGKIGPVLYFWGCPDGSDEETVRDALKEAGAPAPVEVAMQTEKCTTGWITFETPQDATDAICLANHSIVGESARLKLTYAVNKKDGSGSRPSNAK